MEDTIKSRKEIAEQYQWRLEDIYRSNNDWEQDFSETKKLIGDVSHFQGRVGENAEKLQSCLALSEKLERMLEKLYVYARMRRDEDNADSFYQGMFSRIENLSIEAGGAASFIIPELSSLEERLVEKFMEENKELAVYKHYFAELFRQKEHILSAKEEKLLAMSADLSVSTKNIFTMLNNADIKFSSIKDENNQTVEVTKGRYGRFMESSDRRVRQDAFKSLYDSYKQLLNTIGATLNGSLKSDVFYARARNYPSALAAALDSDNIDPLVYERLITSVHDKLPLMYKYMKLRKRILKLEQLHMYDLYNPLVPTFNQEVPYGKALEIMKKGLEPLGDEYLRQVEKGLASGWVDVYENKGKTSGAYSWGSYDTHPYILMNYDNKFDDLFTLAHEMGHSMHSFYANRNQPFTYSQYSIFIAEVASTVNESLLIDYLLQNSQSKQEKMYLLNHYLEQFRGTLFRQTMFAEFEKIVHEKIERGEALTPEDFNKIYTNLNKLYYGPDMALDNEIAWEWARIPHFYTGFYVYKYATGFSAATAIKDRILTQGEAAVKDYLEFLSAGSSDYPLEVLKKAGADLTTPEPVNKALEYFGKLLAQMEELQ
ncbi:MAG: oligoendopeptidase F [Syntrophomonadaceae bacterium]|nr:oligoendopeptidase F [Syntrophomonadaceae bacterium]